MEPKITIKINDQKNFEAKNGLNLEEIKNFIKKEYNLQKGSSIQLYNNNLTKRINSNDDLQKLIEKDNRLNKYIIRINFKSRDIKLPNKTMILPTGNKNKINININNNINKISKDDLEIIKLKNSLKNEISNISNSNEEIDDEKFDEEIKKFKREQQKEIELLEKELNELKRINGDICMDNIDNNDNNLLLNKDIINDFIKNLEISIIDEVKIKINDELNEKIQEVNINEINKQNENYINEQILKKKKELEDKFNNSLNERAKKQKEIENKFNNLININKNKAVEDNNNNNINDDINNNKNNYNQEKDRLLSKFIKRQKYKNDKKSENSNNIKIINKNKEEYDDNNNIFFNEEDINDEEENSFINSKNEIKNINININSINKLNSNFDNKNSKNDNNNLGKSKNFFNNIKKEQPNKVIQINNKNLEKFINPQSEKNKQNNINIFDLLNNIFFKDKKQTIINTQKMNEHYKELLKKEFYKHKVEKNNRVSISVNSFIKNYVLKIFKSGNVSKDALDILKYNISSVLECIEMNRDFYSAEYFPEFKRDKKIYRGSSVEAAKNFRKKYNIKEEEFNQDALLETLYYNNNNIDKVYKIIYEN